MGVDFHTVAHFAAEQAPDGDAERLTQDVPKRKLDARDRGVHVFDDSLRGLAEGHYPWDLESEPNMMTNANIAKVEEVGTDRVLRLNYSGGEQTITIPTSATVVAFDKAPADQLAVGRKVFVVMKKDGLEAAAVVIGAEGVKPPM